MNLEKSKVLFYANFPFDTKIYLSSILGINHSQSFEKYLGFPIIHGKPKITDFQFILDNLGNKFSGWKVKFLNMTGRTTLAKACLGSIPNHVIQYILLPRMMHNCIDRAQRNFILGSTDDKNRMQMVNWTTITQR